MKTGVEGFVLFTDGTTVGIDYRIEHELVDPSSARLRRVVDIFTKDEEHYRYVQTCVGKEIYYLVDQRPFALGGMRESLINMGESIESFMLVDRKGEVH